MLSVDVFHDTAKERQGESGLDVIMAVDGRSDRLDNPFRDPVVSCHRSNHFLILLGEPNSCEQILFLIDMIGLQNSREDREAVLGIERGIEIVPINASHLL